MIQVLIYIIEGITTLVFIKVTNQELHKNQVYLRLFQLNYKRENEGTCYTFVYRAY